MSRVKDVTWDRWEEVDALFAQALDQAPEDRSAFLQAACGRDRALLSAVEALLESDDVLGSSLERPSRTLLRAALMGFLSDVPGPSTREEDAG